MEFTVNYSSFASAVSEINKVISSKSVIPILSGIRIEANQRGLKLTGSNSDIILERTIPLHIEGKAILEIHEYGSTVVLSKFLNEIVKKLPKDIYIKTTHNDSITLKSGDIESKLKGFKSSDFPKVPVMNHDMFVKVPFGKLKKTIKQTAFAVAKSEDKPILTGVKLEFGNKKLSCTATDSHRLARQEIEIESEVKASFVVPSPSLSELINLKESDSAIVDIYYTNNFIAFKTLNRILYSRLIDGIYPNAQSLIPIEPKSIVTLETQLLIAGIDRACVFSTEWKYNNVKMEIVDDATIKISSNSTEVGMIEEFQRSINFHGEINFQMSFDGRSVIEALKRIPEEHVTISFFGLMKPIVIQPRESLNCFHLISPVRSN